jgi:hypothetical protein
LEATASGMENGIDYRNNFSYLQLPEIYDFRELKKRKMANFKLNSTRNS